MIYAFNLFVSDYHTKLKSISSVEEEKSNNDEVYSDETETNHLRMKRKRKLKV